MGGSGETQLSMEQYTIKLREAKLQKELELLQKRENHFKQKKS